MHVPYMCFLDLDQEVMGHQKVWMVLKHCGSPRYRSALQGIALKLLKYSESGSIVHSMLDDFQNLPVHRKEITLLFSFMFGKYLSTQGKIREGVFLEH